MSRVNVYAKVRSDSGREVGVGGRGAQDCVRVWLNTDNAKGEAALGVTAEVMGPGLRSKDRKRKDGDGRRSVFTVTLPDDADAGDWRLIVQTRSGSFGPILKAGHMLGALGDLIDGGKREPKLRAIVDEHKQAELQAAWNIAERITLPGGRTLAELWRAQERVSVN